jgi:hypothetical protein
MATPERETQWADLSTSEYRSFFADDLRGIGMFCAEAARADRTRRMSG